jgi:hypothetical protein
MSELSYMEKMLDGVEVVSADADRFLANDQQIEPPLPLPMVSHLMPSSRARVDVAQRPSLSGVAVSAP